MILSVFRCVVRSSICSTRSSPLGWDLSTWSTLAQMHTLSSIPICQSTCALTKFGPRLFWGCILTYAAPQRISALGHPAFRYLHALLSRLLTGRGDNARVINLRELYFLWSIVAWELIHISHTLACQRHHQAQYPRLNYFFLSIYHTFGTRIGLDRPMH